jgi:hypothetical protein
MSQTAQAARRVVSLPVADRQEPDEEREVPSPEELGDSEDDILRGLDAAAETDTERIAIVRKGKVVLRFTVESLDQRTYDKCRDESMRKEKARGYGGVRLGVDVERAAFNSRLIYWATVEPERQRIWENKAAWRRHNVLCGWDLVGKIIRSFEMERICDRIDVLSGADAENEGQTMEVAGNS